MMVQIKFYSIILHLFVQINGNNYTCISSKTTTGPLIIIKSKFDNEDPTISI